MKTTETIEFITNWLDSYLDKSRQKGFIVGVSGGIDSAVTSFLAAKTGKPLWCVEMPIHQSQDQVNRAVDHIKHLQNNFPNVHFERVNLSNVFDNFVEQMPAIKNDNIELALINSRARIRMTALYYLATLHQSLVVGTGNKIEDFGIGFFTKYGDGGVDISPIADLTKTEVYAMGKELGVITEILNAPPTDGLWGDDRTDEDQIGASYLELEVAMNQFDRGVKEEGLSERELEVYKIYSKLNRANQHKMNPIPVCEIPYELKV